MRIATPLAIAFLLAVAALVGLSSPYRSGDEIGYPMGIVGGIMMLALLLYPLRKRLPILRAAGPMKPWFQAHMALGILGPVLVIFHTGFQVRSVNAAVALASMVVVSLSGVIGRFAYRNIHHGLYGRRASLAEFEAGMVDSSRGLAPLLKAAPNIAARIERYKARASDASGPWWRRAARFLLLGLHMRLTVRACDRELVTVLAGASQARRWNDAQTARLAARGQRLVRAYLLSLRRASQFTAYERIFSLWHVLHIPLVWLMVASAAYHVLAVHMY